MKIDTTTGAKARTTLYTILAASLLFSSARAATLPPEDYQQLARGVLKELIEIDSTHAAGSTRIAQAIEARLLASGFAREDVQLFEPAPGKGNLVVRLRGKGRAKPILFAAHLDVVEAKPEDWSVPPFQFTEKDGYFFGRGAIDVKNEVADLIVNLIRLKRERYVPQRDFIVAFTSDEESGGTLNGVEWLLEHQRPLVDAEFVINPDSGGGDVADGKRSALRLQTGEKYYATFVLETTNPGGHSSLPHRPNAIYQLANALTRLERFDFPIRLSETTRTYFERLASREQGQAAQDMRAVASNGADAEAIARLSASPLFNSTLRTTCVATLLDAGHAESALPQRARATIQCRLFPTDSVAWVRQTLVDVIADPNVSVTVQGEPAPAPESALRADVLKSVEKVAGQLWPGVPVLPVMDPWASDSYYFRFAGIPAYGVSGIFTDQDSNGSHGRDERVGIQEYYEGVEFMYRLMRELGAR